MSNIILSDGAETGATSLVVPSPYALSTANPHTGTQFWSMPSLSSVSLLYTPTKDNATTPANTVPGDHRVGAYFTWPNSPPYYGVMARVIFGTSNTYGQAVGYLWHPVYAGGAANLYYQAFGSQTLLASVPGTFAYTAGNYHYASLTVSGAGGASATVLLQCDMQRLNGDWLQVDGSWNAAHAFCISYTVAAGSANNIARVASYGAILDYTQGTASAFNGVDDFSWSDITSWIALSGSLVSTSAAIGVTSVNIPLASVLTGQSTLSASGNVFIPLTVTLPILSGEAGSLSVIPPLSVPLVGQVTSASILTGALVVSAQSAALLASSSSPTLSLTLGAQLTGSTDGVTVFSGMLTGGAVVVPILYYFTKSVVGRTETIS